MKKTAKFLALCLALVMVFSLAACGKGEDETKDPNLLTVGEFEPPAPPSLPTASTAAR